MLKAHLPVFISPTSLLSYCVHEADKARLRVGDIGGFVSFERSGHVVSAWRIFAFGLFNTNSYNSTTRDRSCAAPCGARAQVVPSPL